MGWVGYPTPPPDIRPGHLPPPPHIGHHTWAPTPLSILLTSGGHHWRPVQTCSLEDLMPQSALTSSGGH